MRVALFVTCLGDQFFADACADAVRLLRHLGVTVDFPTDQTCCGQPAFNSGYRAESLRMMRHTLDVLADAEHVVLPSGSCAGMMRSLYPELAEGTAETARVDGLAGRTFELSEFIVKKLGIERLGSGLQGLRVAFHHGCHSLRELGVEREPELLLGRAGAEVVAWEAARECCGFGGTFSAKLPEVSAGMADRKLDTLPDVDIVTSADPGCLLQLDGRARHRRTGHGFVHLASLLWKAVDER